MSRTYLGLRRPMSECDTNGLIIAGYPLSTQMGRQRSELHAIAFAPELQVCKQHCERKASTARIATTNVQSCDSPAQNRSQSQIYRIGLLVNL